LEGLPEFWGFGGSSAPPYSPFCTLKSHTFDPIPLENPNHSVNAEWLACLLSQFLSEVRNWWSVSKGDTITIWNTCSSVMLLVIVSVSIMFLLQDSLRLLLTHLSNGEGPYASLCKIYVWYKNLRKIKYFDDWSLNHGTNTQLSPSPSPRWE
jgi:hypothetical protein